MAGLLLVEKAPGYYHATGSLTFATIDRQVLKSLRFGKSGGAVCIDLAEVEAADSAGLALIVEWIRLGRDNNVQLSFRHIPAQLLALARLSGFDDNDYFAGGLA